MAQFSPHLDDPRWIVDFATSLIGQGQVVELSDAQLRSLSPLALAYLGDAVYELFVRRCYLTPPQRIRGYHQAVVNHVRAEQQAHYLQLLTPYLTEDEADIVRRSRNAVSGRKPRASLQDYQQATGLEALVGYLYLKNPERLVEMLGYLPLSPDD